MIYIIRHRLIHSLRKYHQTVQPRTIPANPCPIKAILIVNLFAHDYRIADMDSATRERVKKAAIGAEIRTVSGLTMVFTFVSVCISAGTGSCRRNQDTTQAITNSTTYIHGNVFINLLWYTSHTF